MSPIIWSIAGQDSGGGAGLSADQRAADAMGVHLCPVVACLTAQNSLGVQAVYPVSVDQLLAQFDALRRDLPPAAIKTGLLADAKLIEAVARLVRQLRERQPALPLVVDPVLGASAGGAAFSHENVLQAYRQHLLPLATLITPNRVEALRLLGEPPRHDEPDDHLPELATRLRAMGPQAVVITGGDAPHGAWALDWMDTPQAGGWLCGQRVATRHHHGTGCTMATAAASALALGHVTADAVVLSKMLTTQALRLAQAAGAGPGPVRASAAAPLGPLPWLGIGAALPWQLTHGLPPYNRPLFAPFEPPEDGLYGIVPDADRLGAAAQAGLHCLQLRHKARAGVQDQMARSLLACQGRDVHLFINDHWDLALKQPDVPGVRQGIHLGQEDLLGLDDAARAALLAARHRITLGISSHSVWELARAAGCGASLIACGPVKPTTTKDMPWLPQGEINLSWWVRHSPAPVVAIGGLLAPEDLQMAAACGPAAVCVVRGLGATEEAMRAALPALREAVACSRHQISAQATHLCGAALKLPHPVLPRADRQAT
jgi:hydroxymethylpyrimidine kinase/phosphomethylpyrimidine kinase/thiamine-phosphate diphosphorylase